MAVNINISGIKDQANKVEESNSALVTNNALPMAR